MKLSEDRSNGEFIMYKLKYNKIPTEWINGLPISNGRLAAMYWGDGKRDIISLNHERLWSAEYKGKEPDISYDKLPILRELLEKKDYFRATLFANLFFGGFGGDCTVAPGRIDSFQPAGALVFEHSNISSSNKSELDIISGLIEAKRDNKQIKMLCDCNDGTMISLWQDDFGLNGKLYFERENDPKAKYNFCCSQNLIIFKCDFVWNTSFTVEVKISTDGVAEAKDNGIYISGAKKLLCSTNIILSEEDKREHKFDFEKLFTDHKKTFEGYMKRISFSIEAKDKEIPTDERIKRVRRGEKDDKLAELYFHYGRYLMLSCCICATLPPNLQGKWNVDLNPPWKSDYHLDINLQMNEWMIEGANFSEFALPLADFLLSTIPGARKAARNVYGCRGIWLSIGTDIWGEPTPESFGYGVWVGSAAWIAHPLWQHYLYTSDKEFLKEKAYKFFKEVALFYEDFLYEDKDGVMQIMPSQSPENRFKGAGNMATVGICSSSAIDVQLAYDALGYAIEAARILGIDKAEAEKWESLRSKLPPFRIGSDGRLMEWNEEFVEEQPGHKHLSHLYGLYPSNIFTPEGRKEHYDAAVKSFEFRMTNESGYTGWSRAWISNMYARIGNKEGFYKQVQGLLKDFATESLLDIHPDPVKPGVGPDIFQIDGNFGMVSAVIEALCGYFDEKAHVLHALPDEWKNGSISGIKLPGGHTVSFEWKNGKTTKFEVVIGFSEKLVAIINGNETVISGKTGEKVIYSIK